MRRNNLIFKSDKVIPRAISSDICIVGNGLPGLILYSALQFDPRTKHLNVNILDRNAFPGGKTRTKPSENFQNELRTVSITKTSANILRNACAGKSSSVTPSAFLEKANAHRFKHMTVRDMDRNVFSLPTEGHIVGLHGLWRNAWEAAAERHGKDFQKHQICGSIASLESDENSSQTSLQIQSPNNPELKIHAKLLIGCDGAKSLVRESIHGQTFRIDHAQKAFVFCVKVAEEAKHTDSHKVCTCYQNFLRDGSIIAFLPTSPSTGNIVLSASHKLAQRFEAVRSTAGSSESDMREKYIAMLNELLHAHAPHDIPTITQLLPDTTPLFQSKVVASFPLALNVALEPFAPGKVLVGDAARSIHPLAGQGLNLGIADSAVLFDCITEVLSRGGDIRTEVGEVYNRRMRRHSWSMITATECAKQIFKSDTYWMRGLRKYGMRHVNESGLLQRMFSSFASGGVISASLAKN